MKLSPPLFIFSVFFCSNLFSQVPGTLSYQGILMQNDDITPLADGAYSIVFNFYTVATGGSALQTRTVSVTTTKGLFTCIIGDGTTNNAVLPSTLGSQQIYIGIKVDGGAELLPRAILTPSTYSYQAQTAYTISDAAVTTSKIADGSVTNAKLASGIDASKITTGILPNTILPTGTLGNLPFWSTANSFSGDAGLFWDNTNKRLGVGTSSPQRRLHIVGNQTDSNTDDLLIESYLTAATSGNIEFNRSKGTEAAKASVAANDRLGKISFNGYNGTSFITSSQIQSFAETDYATSANSNLIFSTGFGGTSYEHLRITASGNVVVDPIGANTGTIANALIFGLPTSGEGIGSKRNAGDNINGLDFFTNNGTTRMSITQAGNVGIGTSSPSQNLSVQGGMNVDQASANAGTIAPGIGFGGAGSLEAISSKRTAGGNQFGLDFYINGTPRMSLTSAGKIVIDPAGTNTGTINNALVFGTIGSGEGIGSKRNAGGNQNGLDFYTSNGTTRMSITSAGDVGIGTTSPATKLDVDGSIRASGDITIPSIEMYGSPPYIDFHFNGSGADYTSRISESSSGTINIQGNFKVNGVTKNFIIDHPDFKEEKYLIHTTLEGPENGVYYRGKSKLINGEAIVQLPTYFNSLTKDGSATVIVTAIGKKPYLLSYDEFDERSFKVYGTESSGEFSWEVKAERQDVPNLIVEPDKADISVYGNGPYKYYVPKQKSNSTASPLNTKSEKE